MQRVDTTLSRRLPDGLLVLAPRADDPIVITGPSAALWHVTAEPVTFEQAVAVLAEVHGAPEATVATDIAPVWERLLQQGALQEVASQDVGSPDVASPDVVP